MNFKEKNHINGLFGFYGELLTIKQQDYLRYYFEDDYSIVEIAEVETVSRQAVSDNIKRGIDQLLKYEHVLHLQENLRHVQQLRRKFKIILQYIIIKIMS
jgi:uncharacterized protein